MFYFIKIVLKEKINLHSVCTHFSFIKKNAINMQRIALLTIFLVLFFINGRAQYKSFKLNGDGDTLNIIDNKGLKQGKWISSVPEIREEPGYDEEGLYKDDKKEGIWKRYTAMGDIIAIENYRFGGKD